MNNHTDKQAFSRRGFVKSSAAAAAGGLIITSAKTALGSEANSALRLGVIGCGGRGNNDAGGFIRVTNTQVVALADPFEDRLKGTQSNLNARLQSVDRPAIADDKLFGGLDGYQDLLALDDVDFVLITSPVYFHPEHLIATIDAGKHVYCEKPVAADVVGCKQVMEAGKRAEGNVSVVIGFQIRESPEFQEVAKRIHRGDIGDLVSGMVHYHAGALGLRSKEGASEAENRLRNWVFDQALSGDIIVEQNCHVIDICNWYLNSTPISVCGTGGQKARTYGGDCYDHFNLTYVYPNDVHISFSSTQFLKGWGDCRERIFGSDGVADTPYSGHAMVTGENAWRSERTSLLGGTDASKFELLYNSILSGDYLNQTEQGAHSTLTCILGRMAAYEKRPVTWDEMMESNQKYEVDLTL